MISMTAINEKQKELLHGMFYGLCEVVCTKFGQYTLFHVYCVMVSYGPFKSMSNTKHLFLKDVFQQEECNFQFLFKKFRET